MIRSATKSSRLFFCGGLLRPVRSYSDMVHGSFAARALRDIEPPLASQGTPSEELSVQRSAGSKTFFGSTKIAHPSQISARIFPQATMQERYYLQRNEYIGVNARSRRTLWPLNCRSPLCQLLKTQRRRWHRFLRSYGHDQKSDSASSAVVAIAVVSACNFCNVLDLRSCVGFGPSYISWRH